MLDDDRDKQLVRNQLIAIMLMTVAVMVWFQFFAPEPPPPRQEQPAQPVEAPPSEVEEQQDLIAKGFETPVDSAEEGAWPNLPPVPEISEDVAEGVEEVTLSNRYMDLTFTPIGGRLKKASVHLGNGGQNDIQLVPTQPDVPDTHAVYPLGLRFSDEYIGDEIDRRGFTHTVSPDGSKVTFELALEGYGVVRKIFSLTDTPYVFDAHIEYVNKEGRARKLGRDYTPAYVLNWGPDFESHDEGKGIQKTLIWRVDGDNSTVKPGNLPTTEAGAPKAREIPGVRWLAAKSAYFTIGFQPEYEGAQGWAIGEVDRYRFGLTVPPFEVAPGATHTARAKVYVGPMRLDTLAAAWPTFDTSLRFFESIDAMDWFAKVLLNILNFFHDIIPNYGIAIILLTVVVRMVMLPLTLKSMKSMKRMQLLAPEMEEIREKYKEDPQEMNKKIMEMYRERGINPLGGCFPLLLQMPIFIALYRMLWNAYELRGAHFVGWVDDLSEPDCLFAMPFMEGLPFVGAMFACFNLLPILMAASMVVSQKIVPMSGPAQNEQQKIIMTIMPIFFGLITYNMAAGLNLYIFTSTVLGIVQNFFIKPGAPAEKPEAVKKKRAPGRKQHFYTAAKARQRESQRESRKAKGKAKARRK